MTDGYRATLLLVGLVCALSLASWRLLQLESAGTLTTTSRSAAPDVSAIPQPSPHEVHVVPPPAPHDRTAELIDAVRRGDMAAVLALAAKGADVNASGADGLTPLLAAIAHGNATPSVIEKLIRAGADLSARDHKGRDALSIAAEKDDLNAIVTLLKSSDKLPGRAVDALCQAAAQNHVEALKTMIDNGVDANAVAGDGRTALETAIRHGAPDTVRFLLAHGADAGRKSKEGATPLMTAVASGKPEIVEAIVEKPGSLNDRNDRGESALLMAVRAGNAQITKTLVDAGADVNAADTAATTPVMDAAAAGRNELVQILLDKGADLRARDSQGETALSLARKAHHDDTADLLLKAGAPEDAPPP